MSDPVSWLLIEPAWRVVTAEGEEVGTVSEVLGETALDIFDGLSVDSGPLKKATYVPAERVRTIVEGRIELDLTRTQFEGLAESPPGRGATAG